MRLIDADGVIEEIKRNKLLAREPAAERCMEIIKSATTYIETPSYDVDKVARQLEGEIELKVTQYPLHGRYIKKSRAIEIVKAGGTNE